MSDFSNIHDKYAMPHGVITTATGTLTVGGGDKLFCDKTTKNWRRWIYYKQKKGIPDLCVNLYSNKLLIEKIEKAALYIEEGLKYGSVDAFEDAMKEADAQLKNPRSDSAEAIDRLGKICLDHHQYFRAIICFEISLHMRKIMYQDRDNEMTLFSLMMLGLGWSGEGDNHKAITVLEKALKMAENIYNDSNKRNDGLHIVEILSNMGACWERLREHHTAMSCYGRSDKLRKQLYIPNACLKN